MFADVLGAANAARTASQPLTSVFPMEGTWVMQPFPSANHTNVLTIQIPPSWADTKPEGSVAPNIWVRTGCRYDVSADKAQCETGGAGGVYDTSKAQLGPPGATTITEMDLLPEGDVDERHSLLHRQFRYQCSEWRQPDTGYSAGGRLRHRSRAPQNIFGLANSMVRPSNYPM